MISNKQAATPDQDSYLFAYLLASTLLAHPIADMQGASNSSRESYQKGKQEPGPLSHGEEVTSGG